ncbi:MAG: hypothetical protein RL664_2012 [Bacteroidota bacterium]
MGLNLEYSAGQTPIDANESYRNYVVRTAFLIYRRRPSQQSCPRFEETLAQPFAFAKQFALA